MPLAVLEGRALPGDRWSEQDALLAAALTEYEAGLCAGCGHPLHESTDEANDPDDPHGSGRYEALDPVRCFACTVLERKAKQYDKNESPRALRFGAQRVPRVAGRPRGG